MMPSLSALLKASSELYGLSDGAVRLGRDERCLQALGIFMWMVREATDEEQAAAASYAGHSLASAASELARVEIALARDAQFSDLVHEALFTTAAVEELQRRNGRSVPAIATVEIARRVLGGRASSMTVGTVHIRQMAAALLALGDSGVTLKRRQQLAERNERVRAAFRKYEADKGSPAEASALRSLILAAGLLADELEPIVLSPSKSEFFHV